MKNNKKPKKNNIGDFMRTAMWMWARSNPLRLFFFLKVGSRLLFAKRKKTKKEKNIKGIIPSV
jgi:hypothetical protein